MAMSIGRRARAAPSLHSGPALALPSALALDALVQSVGPTRKYRNLRKMPGAWSKQEASAFDRMLSRERVIDEELWQ